LKEENLKGDTRWMVEKKQKLKRSKFHMYLILLFVNVKNKTNQNRKMTLDFK